MKSFEIYDCPEGRLFSSMVSCEVFTQSDIVLGSVEQFQEIFRQFSEALNSSQKSQTVLRSFEQFSEVLNSSRKIQRVLESFKYFSEFSNSSRNCQIVLRSFKQFSKGSNGSWKLQMFLDSLKSSRRSQTVLGSLKLSSQS